VPARAASIIHISPTGSDALGDGSSAKPFATITHGVGAASSGDTVMVGAGTYHEYVNVTKKLTLRSLSGEPSDTIIDATGLSMGIFVRGSDAAGTVVSGFTVRNANDHGIYVQDTSKALIENNFVANNGGHPNPAFAGEDKAISLTGTSYSLVSGNTVVNNLFGGISVNDNGPKNPGFYSPGTLAPALGNVVSNNIVIGNRPGHCAIVVSALNEGAGVINNVVSNNLVVDNNVGIVIAANTLNSHSINNSVLFNTIVNNGIAGVIVHANDVGALNYGTMVVGNTISGNGIGINLTIGGHLTFTKYTGVLVGGESPAGSVDKTTIFNNVFHDQTYGIFNLNSVFNKTTNTLAFSNIMDQSVTHPIAGGSLTTDSLTSQVTALAGALTSVQDTISQLQSTAAKSSDLSSLSGTVTALNTQITQIQSSAAKQSDLNTVSGKVNSLSGNVDSLTGSTTMNAYIAYAALAISLIVAGMVLVLSRRRPAPST